jgi:aquaporin Z
MDVERMGESRKYIAELIGTFVLVFIGCGSAVLAGAVPFGIGYLGIAFAFGISVLAMVYAIGGISGCHINPAISIAMLIAGKMKAKDTVIYIVMQCIGAIIAAGVLLVIVTGQTGVTTPITNLGQNGYDSHSPLHYSMVAGLVAEVVLTMIFLLVIFGSTSKKAPAGFAGISIGLSLTMIHLVGIPITGTSVNPARSLGPALFVGGDAIGQLWLFWVAPILGGIIAALVWRYVLEEKEAVPTA